MERPFRPLEQLLTPSVLEPLKLFGKLQHLMPLKPLTPSTPDAYRVHAPWSESPLQVFGTWIRPTTQLHRHRFGASFEDNMAVKQNYVLVFVGFVFGSEAILKNDSGD